MILARNFRSSLPTFGDHSIRNFCEFGKQIKSIKNRNSNFAILNFKIEDMVARLRDTLRLLPSDRARHCLPQNISEETNLENSKFNFEFWNSHFQIIMLQMVLFCFRNGENSAWKPPHEQLIWAEMILAEKWFYLEISESSLEKSEKWY